MADEQREPTLAEEAGLPDNWLPVSTAPIIPGQQPAGAPPAANLTDKYFSGTLSPTLQHDVSFVGTQTGIPRIPNFPLLPLGPSGTAAINSAIKNIINETIVPVPSVVGEMIWKGQWNSYTPYKKYDVVQFNISTYLALSGNSGIEPDTSSTTWALVSKNLNFRGQYSNGAPMLMQSRSALGSFVANVPTNFAFTSNTTANNSIVVYVAAINGLLGSLSVTDSQGNTYSQIGGYVDNAGDLRRTAIFAAPNIVGGACTVHITYNENTISSNIMIMEYNCQSATPVPSFQGIESAGSPTATVTTTGSNLVALFYYQKFAGTATPPAGFVLIQGSGAPSGNSSFWEKSVNTSGSAGYTVTNTSGNYAILWALAIAGNNITYVPYDVVEYLGSTYVCIKQTTSVPTINNTTYWVQLSQGAGSINTLISSYAADSTDYGKMILNSSSSSYTLTLPNPIILGGWWVVAQNSGTGLLTINPNGLNINASSANIVLGPGQGVLIFNDGSNYFTESGNTGGLIPAANVNLTGQTSNKTSTTAYATGASGAGLYRLTVYMVVSQAATSSSTLPDSQLIFTDQDSGATITIQATSGLSTNTTSTFAQATYIVNAAASSNINFAIGQVNSYASSGATPMKFVYRLRVEYLQ